jgi:hypothetical protein
MSRLKFGRNKEPAEDDGLPNDIKRDVQDWVRNWPRVQQAYDVFEDCAKDFVETNRSINAAVTRKLNSRGLSGAEQAGLKNLLARTVAVHDTIKKLI